MKTGVLWLSQDGECGNGVFKSRYIHRLNVVIGHSEHHVSARHPHPGRALPAETLQGAHQLINVGLDLRLVKGDGFISGLVGWGIGHEGVATRTEREGRTLTGVGTGKKNIIIATTLVQSWPIVSSPGPLSKPFKYCKMLINSFQFFSIYKEETVFPCATLKQLGNRFSVCMQYWKVVWGWGKSRPTWITNSINYTGSIHTYQQEY